MENNAQNIVDDFSLDYLEGVSEDGLSRQEVPGGKGKAEPKFWRILKILTMKPLFRELR